jgi:8-oxo-dGTP pyrophosphatase MutT (NUDIX family)
MIRAAGILFLNDDGEALFLKRGLGGDWPGVWCFPGGEQERDETAMETAERECREELGFGRKKGSG